MSKEKSVSLEFDYAKFLTGFLNAGQNLSIAMPIFAEGVDDFQKGVQKFEEGGRLLFGNPAPSPPMLSARPEITEDVAKLEKQVCAQVRHHFDAKRNATSVMGQKLGAIGDGQLIALFRQLWTFVQANPQLVQFFIQLFTQSPVTSTQV